MGLLRAITEHRISPTNVAIRVFAVGDEGAPPLGYLFLTPIEKDDPAARAPIPGNPVHDLQGRDSRVRIWVDPDGHWRIESVHGAITERHVGGPTSAYLRFHGSEELPGHQGVTWDAVLAAMTDWFAEAVRARVRPSDTGEIAKHLEYARLLQARRYLKRVAAGHPETASSWRP